VPEGMMLAFPLQYVYSRTAFVLQRPEPDSLALRDQVQAWSEEGRHVFVFVSQGASRLSPQLFALVWQGQYVLHWQQLEYPLDRPPAQAVEQELRYNVYRLATAGGGAGVQSEERVIDVGASDYPYLAEGFWGPEQTPAGMTFRWTDGDATVELPSRWFAASGPLTLTLDVQQGWEAREDAGSVEVWLNEMLLGRISPDLQMRAYDLPLPQGLPALLAAQDTVLLRLSGSTWLPAAAGLPDTRVLGVMVDAIAVH
jgi:hypothetical protein